MILISVDIQCGTVGEKRFEIHYYGEGIAVYSTENSACKAKTGEGHHHFVFEDVLKDSACDEAVHVSVVPYFL